MQQPTGFYPSLTVDTTAKRVVSHAGAVLLVTTAGKVGLDRELSAALAPWRKQWAVLDPGKILLDLAISVAVGGVCLADISALRSEPAVFGRVASDPTVSRLINSLAQSPQTALAAINTARAAVRQRVWKLAGKDAPDYQISAERPLVVDLDATLITSHSEKELVSLASVKGPPRCPGVLGVIATGHADRTCTMASAPPIGQPSGVAEPAEQQSRYFQLMKQGWNNSDACRSVGISRKTGTRWRLGRTETKNGRTHSYPPREQVNTTGISARFLSEHERVRIADLHRLDHTLRFIADDLGRAVSTISRELRRNADPASGGYLPRTAHGLAAARRLRPKTPPGSGPTRCCGTSSTSSWRSGTAPSRSTTN